jgi:hypothetical protein
MEKAIQPPTVFSGGFPLDLLQKSFSSIDGTGKMPIPQELFFLVGWAEEPVLIIFARRLLSEVRQAGSFIPPLVSI